jgi:hypothetical protein
VFYLLEFIWHLTLKYNKIFSNVLAAGGKNGIIPLYAAAELPKRASLS